MFELVAIDLDGTLVDSVGDLHAAIVCMQRALGRQCSSVDDVRHWVGNGIERLVHRALTGSMSDDADARVFESAMAEFLCAYDQANGTLSTLYPDVADGLDWLSSLAVPVVVVTNKARRFAHPLLEKLNIGHYVDHLVAGDDVEARKPAPDALLQAALQYNVEPTRCVLIGDSITDIKAARAAGFTVFCVSYGYNHGQPVRQLTDTDCPDAIVDSFNELPGLFSRRV